MHDQVFVLTKQYCLLRKSGLQSEHYQTKIQICKSCKKQDIIYSLEAPQILNRKKKEKITGTLTCNHNKGVVRTMLKSGNHNHDFTALPLPKPQSPKSQTNSSRYPIDAMTARQTKPKSREYPADSDLANCSPSINE